MNEPTRQPLSVDGQGVDPIWSGPRTEALRSAYPALIGAAAAWLQLTHEHELAPRRRDGRLRYPPELGPTHFQIASERERPHEYLQTLLDMIRVEFEPEPLGTALLNANSLDYLVQNVPEVPFRFGYASVVSDPDLAFGAFWERVLLPRLASLGYELDHCAAAFVVLSTGAQRYRLSLVREVGQILDVGLRREGKLIRDGVVPLVGASGREVYSGFCRDDALGRCLRASVWLFLREPAPGATAPS